MNKKGVAGIVTGGFRGEPQNLAMAAWLMNPCPCLVTDAMKTTSGIVTLFDLCGAPMILAAAG